MKKLFFVIVFFLFVSEESLSDAQKELFGDAQKKLLEAFKGSQPQLIRQIIPGDHCRNESECREYHSFTHYQLTEWSLSLNLPDSLKINYVDVVCQVNYTYANRTSLAIQDSLGVRTPFGTYCFEYSKAPVSSNGITSPGSNASPKITTEKSLSLSEFLDISQFYSSLEQRQKDQTLSSLFTLLNGMPAKITQSPEFKKAIITSMINDPDFLKEIKTIIEENQKETKK